MSAPADPSSLSRSELEAEVAALRGEAAELKQLVVALREENARLAAISPSSRCRSRPGHGGRGGRVSMVRG